MMITGITSLRRIVCMIARTCTRVSVHEMIVPSGLFHRKPISSRFMRFPAKASATREKMGIRAKRNLFISKNYSILRLRFVINLTVL